MQLETDSTTQKTTLVKSTVLMRVEQNYRQDGQVEVSAYFADRTVYPDGLIVDGPLMPRQATYPSPEAMAQSAANTSGLPLEQIKALLDGYTAMIWGMKAAIENSPKLAMPIDLADPSRGVNANP